GEVRVPPDRAGVLLEGPLHAFLELPDPHHLREDPAQPVLVETVRLLVAAHPRAPFLLTQHRRGIAPRSFRMPVRRSPPSGGCGAPPRAPRRPTGPGSRAPGRPRHRPGSGTPPHREGGDG